MEIKQLLREEAVMNRITSLLGKRAEAFVSTILQVSQNSALMKKADPMSIVHASVTAATLGLSLAPSLGEAWIVPYKDRQSGKVLAQFQLGYKGFITLAHRTNKYTRLNVVPVDVDHFVEWNPLDEEITVNFSKPASGKIAGYAGMFRLQNGFQKRVWWTFEEVTAHAKRFSDSYGKGFSPWSNDFDAMAIKTVVKHMISKWGPKSIELEIALQADQSAQVEEGSYTYVDNQDVTNERNVDQVDADKQRKRVLLHIANATTSQQLVEVADHRVTADGPDEEIIAAFDAAMERIMNEESNGDNI